MLCAVFPPAENMTELDNIMNDVSNVAQRIKQKLDQIKGENDKFSADKVNQNSATTQMRANMYQVRTHAHTTTYAHACALEGNMSCFFFFFSRRDTSVAGLSSLRFLFVAGLSSLLALFELFVIQFLFYFVISVLFLFCLGWAGNVGRLLLGRGRGRDRERERTREIGEE